MTLPEQIMADLKTAMKAKDEMKTNVLRGIISEFKYIKIQKMKEEPTEADMIDGINKLVKQRNDAIEQFTAGGRPELAEKEQKEKEILMQYMPAQMDEQALDAIITKAVTDSGAKTAKEFGMVAKLVMPQVKGKADSKIVTEKIKKLLGA